MQHAPSLHLARRLLWFRVPASVTHNPIRVAVAGTTLGEPDLGGGRTFVEGLVNQLSSDSCIRLGLILPSGASTTWLDDPGSVDVIRVPRHAGARRVVADLLSLQWSLATWRPDIVHYPHEWCPLVTAPTILTVQNIAYMHPRTRQCQNLRGPGLLLRLLTRLTAHRSAVVVAVSSEAASLYRSESRYRGRIVLLPEVVTIPPLTERLGTAPPPFVLGVVGAAEYKGLDLLQRAWALVDSAPRHDLRIAGAPGVDLGRIPRNELLMLMCEARVVVVPSAVESFGLPAFEALAVGTPAVVLRSSAMAEWASGTMYEAEESAASLAREIEAALGSNARGTLPSGLEPAAVGAQWSALYRQVAKRSCQRQTF